MQILLVEDDNTLFQELKKELEQWDFNVVGVEDFGNVMNTFERFNPEIVILDVQLPKYDGFYWCRKMRQESNVPILFLSSRDNPMDQVMSMELGADDYMTKPFSPREVVARVKAILRRSKFVNEIEKEDTDEEDIIIDSIRIRPEFFEVYKDEELLELTPKEFELLLYLIERQGRVITREHMLNSVWNYEFAGDSRIVDVHISHLRDKLEKVTDGEKIIKTVWGVGYKVEV